MFRVDLERKTRDQSLVSSPKAPWGSRGLTREKLSDTGTDEYRRLAKRKERVDERSSASKDSADDPHPESQGRHGWIVSGVDVGSDLQVR